MRKKPDRKVVAATLAFLVGAATAAVGHQPYRPSAEGHGLLDSQQQQQQQAERTIPKLSERIFTVTGGS